MTWIASLWSSSFAWEGVEYVAETVVVICALIEVLADFEHILKGDENKTLRKSVEKRAAISLPSQSGGYNPRTDLRRTRAQHPTTGKVIPELKFVFWQKMFTSRYDVRLWNAHLQRVVPNLDPNKTVAQLRQEIYADLEHVRALRNRIAHHEPIFKRNLLDDLDKITALIRFRCELTADWMTQNQWVTEYF